MRDSELALWVRKWSSGHAYCVDDSCFEFFVGSRLLVHQAFDEYKTNQSDTGGQAGLFLLWDSNSCSRWLCCCSGLTCSRWLCCCSGLTCKHVILRGTFYQLQVHIANHRNVSSVGNDAKSAYTILLSS